MKKLTLGAMNLLAKEKGGRCLSSVYVNSASPLIWKCRAGHHWSATPESIKKGTWCPECAGVRRLTLVEIQRLAESRGGRCLSNGYVNGATKLSWRCSEGHQWTATPSQVRKGHWCPSCARVARLSLHELQQVAASKGGQCLSVEYLNSWKPLRWSCRVGHEWQAPARSIRAGRWCPFCVRNRKLRLKEMREIARKRGGKCLSTSYENGRAPLIWECKVGHRWKAPAERVKDGSRRKGAWCPECYDSRRRFHAMHTIEEMRSLATSRGGVCLSNEYLGAKSKLLWQCMLGHLWLAIPASVLQGTWCPTCARNQRLGLSEFQDLATSRGGACLSDAYVNEWTHLLWRCAQGHRWEATPGKVKRGSWCPKCALIQRRRKWARPGRVRPILLDRVKKSMTLRHGRTPIRRRVVLAAAGVP
jgi:hypothetical protein